MFIGIKNGLENVGVLSNFAVKWELSGDIWGREKVKL